jgi:hypothetical protein
MRKFVLAGIAAIASTALSAVAGPLLTINASVGGYAPVMISSNGAATAFDGRYSYVGGFFGTSADSFPDAAWSIGWNLIGEDTAVFTDTTFITNGFRVQNLTGTSKTFDITVSLAAPGPSDLHLDCKALLGGTLTSNLAGSVASLTSSGPLWIGQINGLSRSSTGLMNNANESTGGTKAFGDFESAWNGTVTGALQSVGYRLQFTLSAHSTATFTGYWDGAVVPAPGAFATLAMAAVIAGRRRRMH